MIQLSNSEYAALVGERDQLAVRVAAQAQAIEALQALDFKPRADGDAGLPAEACKIIDGVAAD